MDFNGIKRINGFLGWMI